MVLQGSARSRNILRETGCKWSPFLSVIYVQTEVAGGQVLFFAPTALFIKPTFHSIIHDQNQKTICSLCERNMWGASISSCIPCLQETTQCAGFLSILKTYSE
jgi:hypothetical protein